MCVLVCVGWELQYKGRHCKMHKCQQAQQAKKASASRYSYLSICLISVYLSTSPPHPGTSMCLYLRIQVLLSFYLSISLCICLHFLHIQVPLCVYISASRHSYLSICLYLFLSIRLHLLHIRYPYVSISPHPRTPTCPYLWLPVACMSITEQPGALKP